jgi:predicted dehydrogenase
VTSLPAVKVGIVGFGSIARSHLSALRALPATRPLAVRPVFSVIVSDRVDEVRPEADALGIERVVRTVTEALEDADLQLLDVTSRNDAHAAQATEVLRAGRALYIEKPVARTAEEARELADLAEASGAIAQPGLVMRYEPAVARARALVHQGAIGTVVHGYLANLHGSYLNPERPMSWRLRGSVAGGGAMLDLGVHALDAARFILGEPRLVGARARTVVPERPTSQGERELVDVDDWAWAELEVGVARINIEASRASLGAEGMPFQLFGTEGSLVGDAGSGALQLRRFDGGEAAFETASRRDPWLRVVEELRPPPRLTLGSFVDLHAAALHHALLRVAGLDPAQGLAPSLTDAAVSEQLAHEIVDVGMATERDGLADVRAGVR